jgi:adenylate cyclase
MLTITITGPAQSETIDLTQGPLEFGRGPRRECPRFLLTDGYASRDHLRLEELADGQVRVENLSHSQAVHVVGGDSVAMGRDRVLRPPFELQVGQTAIGVAVPVAANSATSPLLTISQPARLVRPEPRGLQALGADPSPERLAEWLEVVVNLQHSSAGLPELFAQAAKAMVELVGLDLGLMVLHRDGQWTVVAGHATDDRRSMRYSRTLVQHVATQRRTFYQDPSTIAAAAQSLVDIDAAVVSPVFGLHEDVVGVLYGVRTFNLSRRNKITALEAQVVQLLATAVSAAIARTTAVRTRVQFEQFFSPELVRELERNPALLEGRNQVVTVLVSDLRGFTRMSEALGAEVTCGLIRDMMEQMTDRIAEEGGVIVDYAGDGILAMWNAPVEQPDHAARAARAALAMQAEMPALNARWQGRIGGPLQLGIGLNTGPAQVGNTGSPRKFKYGPHGHSVNLASRVQDATKKLGRGLLLTAATRELLPAEFRTAPAATVALAGVREEVALFALEGPAPCPGQ